ncbi:coiled-coil domain-containing protein 162-like, partial [Plakobranchus ocellatus]
ITALRAKVVEMREMSLHQESNIRERVREEYNDLIHSIFNSTFQLRSKFDQFRNELQDDVFDKINDTRREAVDAMAKLQQKFKGTTGERRYLCFVF